jgi:threonine synthase
VSGPAASVLACAGCGAAPPAGEPYPFRCGNAVPGDGVDHVLARTLVGDAGFPGDGESNPFVRYRALLHAYHRARAGGISDEAFVPLVRALDARVAAVEGRGFAATPFAPAPPLGARLGLEVWVKDETGNVAGSHKARHLFGILLHLEVAERIALTTRAETDRRGLAIASCGNAALAAAVVARAAARPLEVFIPTDADLRVVARLESLGARIAVCPRIAGERGDPCFHALRRALAAGALPFGCQGSENGLTIEGGETLAWEMAAALAGRGAVLDRLFVQVGGGALASACVQGLREAVTLGALPRLPRIHAVQTRGAWPLRRAYERVRDRILARPGGATPDPATRGADAAALADRMREPQAAPAVREALRYAQTHRSEFMWPWEETPASVAHGILDDETYDWHAVVAGMIETGGWPITVSEETLAAAHALARETTEIRADHTGVAGLAGLMGLAREGGLPAAERAAVLFTGLERAG